MEKEFIPYEESLTLKELGFDEPCFGMYGQSNQDLYTVYKKKFDSVDILHFIKAPLYQQAFKWFREKHNLSGVIQDNFIEDSDYYSSILNIKTRIVLFEGKLESYEKAELECLKKLIEIIKNRKNG